MLRAARARSSVITSKTHVPLNIPHLTYICNCSGWCSMFHQATPRVVSAPGLARFAPCGPSSPHASTCMKNLVASAPAMGSLPTQQIRRANDLVTQADSIWFQLRLSGLRTSAHFRRETLACAGLLEPSSQATAVLAADVAAGPELQQADCTLMSAGASTPVARRCSTAASDRDFVCMLVFCEPTPRKICGRRKRTSAAIQSRFHALFPEVPQ